MAIFNDFYFVSNVLTTVKDVGVKMLRIIANPKLTCLLTYILI